MYYILMTIINHKAPWDGNENGYGWRNEHNWY